ncbi:MAG: acyltransferase [Cellulomonadaceae bacterium]|nr:acyltransferase [Cellulomonadaceae bacterium]
MKRVEWANALRGAAALIVIVAHFGVVFWMNQDAGAGLARRSPLYSGDAAAPGFARLLAAAPLEFGALGVALFFLLSGYVIAISLDRYSRRGFIIGRAMRVLPTYAAGYLVTCAVVWAMSDPGGELVPSHVLAGMIPGLPIVLGIPAPADGIVWTLIVELVFYGVCLVAYRSLTRSPWVILAASVTCAAAQLVIPVPLASGTLLGGILYILLLACPFIPVMLVGATLSAARRGQVSRQATALLVPVLVVTHVVLLSTSAVLPVAVEYRATFVVAIALFCVFASMGRPRSPHRLSSFFADISYPLYVVHPVLGYAFLSVLAGRGVPAIVAVLAATIVAIAAAWLLHVAVERPSHRWGRRWAGRFADAPRADEAARGRQSEEPVVRVAT